MNADTHHTAEWQANNYRKKKTTIDVAATQQQQQQQQKIGRLKKDNMEIICSPIRCIRRMFHFRFHLARKLLSVKCCRRFTWITIFILFVLWPYANGMDVAKVRAASARTHNEEPHLNEWTNWNHICPESHHQHTMSTRSEMLISHGKKTTQKMKQQRQHRQQQQYDLMEQLRWKTAKVN